MTDLEQITTHDSTDDCVVCRAQQVVARALLPAATAWEASEELPRFSVALHGAAGLLGTLLEDGVPREDIERALSALLEEIEGRIAEDSVMGGPPQGTA